MKYLEWCKCQFHDLVDLHSDFKKLVKDDMLIDWFIEYNCFCEIDYAVQLKERLHRANVSYIPASQLSLLRLFTLSANVSYIYSGKADFLPTVNSFQRYFISF